MKRALILSTSVAVMTAVLAVSGPVAPASAARLSPNAPTPVNVLPSTVGHLGASTGVGAPASYQQMVYFLYQASETVRQNPGIIDAGIAKRAGTATSTQLATITTVQPASRIPTGAISSFARGGAAMVAAEAGIMMGVGVVDFFWADRQGQVCRNTGTDPLGELVALAARADCSGLRLDPADGFVPNAGLSPGVSWGQICTANGRCFIVDQYGFSAVRNTWLFSFTGTGIQPSDEFFFGFEMAVRGTTWNGCAASSVCYVPFTIDRRPNGTVVLQAREIWPTATIAAGIPASQAPSAATFDGYRLNGGPLVATTTTPADPLRTMRCVIAGSNGQTYNGPGIQYRETDDSFPTPRCPDLPADVIPQSTWIESTYPGGDVVRLFEQTTAPEVVTAHNEYPLCRDASCTTQLQKGSTNCHERPADCLNWYDDPNKAASYQCTYGPYTVALSECTIYAEGFRAPSTTSTSPANPDTLSDPTTGEPIQSPFPAGRDAATFDNIPGDASAPRVCFPTGWAALNPVEWVFRPVQCALEWAFVPRQSVIQGHMSGLVPAYLDTMPGELHATVSAWSFDAPATNCNGVTVDMGWIPNQQDVQLLNACPGEPLEPFAGWAKFFFYVGFTVVGTLGVIRNAAATVGYRGIGGDS